MSMSIKKFTFAVHYTGYSKKVIAYGESKWLAAADVRQSYPGRQFNLVPNDEEPEGV